MSPRVHVIRFARVTEPLSTKDGGTVSAHLWLHDQPAPVGLIVHVAGVWEYRFADGTRSGLSSDVSRQVLERQIVLYHLGALPGPTVKPAPKVAGEDWFAAAI
jgi:hypothetical protein